MQPASVYHYPVYPRIYLMFELTAIRLQSGSTAKQWSIDLLFWLFESPADTVHMYLSWMVPA